MALRTSDVVREPTRVPDPTRAQGKDVRITLNDGTTHRGKLAAITGSVVTIDGRTIPLADVLKIEKVGHATRKAVVIGMLAFAPTVLVLGPTAGTWEPARRRPSRRPGWAAASASAP